MTADSRWRAFWVLIGALVVAGATLVVALITSGDDGTDETASTTSAAPTTATTAPDYSEAVAGLLSPPEGVAQPQADAFAADLTAALDEASWPELDRQASVDLLQQGLDTAVVSCRLLDTSTEIGPAAVEGAAQYAATGQLPDLTASLEASGVPPETADEMARGFLTGVYDAASGHICPQHAEVLTEATRSL